MPRNKTQLVAPTTTASTAPIKRSRSRTRIALMVILLVGTGGTLWYFFKPSTKVLAPPAVPSQEVADREVVEVIESARQKVIGELNSAAAWGNLGIVFAAHNYEKEADDCFAESERLDPTDARWPYYRGVFAASREPDQAILHLRHALAAGTTRQDALSSIRLRLA